MTAESYPGFIDHLAHACDAAGTGFYFEEGGCWGMAIALQAALERRGHPSEIVVNPEWRHAMVRSGDRLFDYSGEVAGSRSDLSTRTANDLLDGYAFHGWEREKIECDVDDASGIIENAANLDWALWDRESGSWNHSLRHPEAITQASSTRP